MGKLNILKEEDSVFTLQKLHIPTDLLPVSWNGKFAIINAHNGMFYICQIFTDRLLHQNFCKINKCVYGRNIISLESNHLTGEVNHIESSDINLISSVDNIKSMTVSLVLNSPLQTLKWKNSSKTNEIVKNILKLFVVRNDSIISLKGIKMLLNVEIDFIIVENVGKVNVGKINNFTKVRLNKVISKVTFEQIYSPKEELPLLGGLEEPMQALSKLIEICQACKQSRNHQTFKQVLLLGPSGCGKTALVRQVAKDRRAVLKVVLGPELCSPLPGESERALTSVFDECKLLAEECESGCILLLDQVDILCSRPSHSAESHVVRLTHQLLSLLELVHLTPGFMVVGTSSRPQNLDPAVRRPGRFDHEIHIRVSDERERGSIVRAAALQLGMSHSVSERVALWTPGFVAADLVLLASNVARHLLKMGLPISYDEDEPLAECWRICVGRMQPSALKGQVGAIRADDIGAHTQLAGLDIVKRSLAQAIQWPLTNPGAFLRLGLPQPKGVLLYGPPGCAKTSLARDIAAATNTTFLAVSAAQIYSPYVGDAEKTIAELFHRARIGGPSILFIDEIDALVGSRGHREKGTQERILTTLLTEMDGIGVRVDSATILQSGVVVVAATNRPEVLDPALTRPGRFDRLIYVGPPDTSQRLEILKTVTKKMPLASDVNLELLAEKTGLFSGADLARLSKEAGLSALAMDGMGAGQVGAHHWHAALSAVKPSLTQDQILHYQRFSFAR